MALAICLLFDTRSERLVRELWGRLETVGVRTLASHTHGRHLPHLSYAVLRDGTPPSVLAALAELSAGPTVELGCRGAVVFPRGRVALAVAVSADLVSRQTQVVAALKSAGLELHRHYEPGAWVPHISVATRATGTQLPLVVTEVSDALPLDLVASHAALIDSATGQTWPLPVLP
jgi:2'-5' RNA ligase